MRIWLSYIIGYVNIKVDKENPKMNPFIYNRKILKIIPIMVKPNIHIINEYNKLVIMLFLNIMILFKFLLSIFEINCCIFSMTIF